MIQPHDQTAVKCYVGVAVPNGLILNVTSCVIHRSIVFHVLRGCVFIVCVIIVSLPVRPPPPADHSIYGCTNRSMHSQTAKKYSIPSRIISRAKELSAAFDDICRGTKEGQDKKKKGSNDAKDSKGSKGSEVNDEAEGTPCGPLVFRDLPPTPLQVEGEVMTAATAGAAAAAAGVAEAGVELEGIVRRDGVSGGGGAAAAVGGGTVESERGWWPSDGEGWGGSSSAGGFRTMADAAQVCACFCRRGMLCVVLGVSFDRFIDRSSDRCIYFPSIYRFVYRSPIGLPTGC